MRAGGIIIIMTHNDYDLGTIWLYKLSHYQVNQTRLASAIGRQPIKTLHRPKVNHNDRQMVESSCFLPMARAHPSVGCV